MGTTSSSPGKIEGSSNAFEPIGGSKSPNNDNDDYNDVCCLVAAHISTPRSSSNSSAPQRQKSYLHKPSKLLWGCSSTEEHYEYIFDACKRVKHLHGEAGLRELGLEYQMVHNSLSCQCDVELDDGGDANSVDDVNPSEWNDDYSDDADSAMVYLADSHEAEEYLVPLVDSQCSATPADMPDYLPKDSKRSLPKSLSNVSLFSLATHHTWSPGEELADDVEPECALRLVYKPPSSLDRRATLVEPDNYEHVTAAGAMYNEVSRLCMEYAHAVMMEEGNLCWVTISPSSGIRALVSKHRPAGTRKKKVLLVVTGKGKVQAGIFSRRHIMTTGIEASTALPMIREARRRDMDIIILDPNANGDTNGMATVDTSLRYFFSADAKHKEDLYVIAHSMAGAQMVRYMLSSDDCANIKEELALCRMIKAMAFTDSNHNINWTKKTPHLTDMLVGPSSLYIKAHKIHQDEPNDLGMPHHDCPFWRHRFGDIRTIWAGTHEHALTNYTARHYIWEHFDSHGDLLNL